MRCLLRWRSRPEFTNGPALMKINCEQCGRLAERATGHVNRSRKISAPLYCNRTCAGLARRTPPKSKGQKVEEKRLYDIEYRRKNLVAIKDKKRAYFRETYDPAIAAAKRKERMPWHVAYCRRPEYRQWKQGYDARYRANRMFGEFADAALLLNEIDREVTSRMSKYEIGLANGTINKAQLRRRAHERLISSQP